MKKLLFAAAILASGCATLGRTHGQETLAGHWNGTVQHDGWQRTFALDVPSDGRAWHARWLSQCAASDPVVTELGVEGDDVRFILDDLRFTGRVGSDHISGTVATQDGSAGEFSLVREDAPEIFNL